MTPLSCAFVPSVAGTFGFLGMGPTPFCRLDTIPSGENQGGTSIWASLLGWGELFRGTRALRFFVLVIALFAARDAVHLVHCLLIGVRHPSSVVLERSRRVPVSEDARQITSGMLV